MNCRAVLPNIYYTLCFSVCDEEPNGTIKECGKTLSKPRSKVQAW